MNFIVMLLLLLSAAALQTLQPTLVFMGQAKAPLLPAVTLYYALRREKSRMLLAALLAGMIQDGTSLIPMGVSSACFAVMGLVVSRFAHVVTRDHPLSLSLIGGGAGVLLCLSLWAWLSWSGAIRYGAGWALTKTFWTAVLGMWTAPLVYLAACGLDGYAGNIQTRESVSDIEP